MLPSPNRVTPPFEEGVRLFGFREFVFLDLFVLFDALIATDLGLEFVLESPPSLSGIAICRISQT